MKIHFLLVATAALAAMPLLADNHVLDCSRGQSLSQALQNASWGETIQFTGVCHDSVTIQVSALKLIGKGTAVISSPQTTLAALTVNGAHLVSLSNFTLQNGLYGLHVMGGSGVTLSGITSTKNAVSGILVENSSSAYISNTTVSNNAVNGIDAENSSSLSFTGNITTQGNTAFGLDVGDSSSASLTAATFTATGNTLGIQIGLSASCFITDPASTLTASNNFTTGLTIVSGAHMVDFGGTIVASNNGINGISLFSRSGLDMDAASLVTAASNGQDGVHLEELSSLNLFNTPAFSGVPGVTTLIVTNNAQNGVSALLNSMGHMFNQTTITSQGNGIFGIQVDNGSSLTLLQSTVTGNTTDISMTFGSRGEFTGNSIGKVSCDATALIRGDTGVTCPH